MLIPALPSDLLAHLVVVDKRSGLLHLEIAAVGRKHWQLPLVVYPEVFAVRSGPLAGRRGYNLVVVKMPAPASEKLPLVVAEGDWLFRFAAEGGYLLMAGGSAGAPLPLAG